jgi:hypothetical protein
VRVDDVPDALDALKPRMGQCLVWIKSVRWLQFQKAIDPVFCFFGDIVPNRIIKRIVASYYFGLDLYFIFARERWITA